MGDSHQKNPNVFSDMVRFFRSAKTNSGFCVRYFLFHMDLGYPKKIKVIDLGV